jgi:hypothetical protein
MDIGSILRPVSRSAAAVFEAVVARIPEGSDSVKLDHAPGTFMALHVARVLKNEHGVIFSFAHFCQEHGDLVPDPLVDMLRTSDGTWYPLSFESAVGHRQYVDFRDDGTVGVDRRRQRDLASFCSMWARNIAEQQGLKVRR